MHIIAKATKADITQIKLLTQKAFTLYQNELNSDVKVDALYETSDDILLDINHNYVFVAKDISGRLLGAIRYSLLNSDIAYIYRFAVDSDFSHTGLGTELLKAALDDAKAKGAKAATLYTNAKYFTLARYYYGKEFFVHSTDSSKGYIRALFIKELSDCTNYNLTPVFSK